MNKETVHLSVSFEMDKRTRNLFLESAIERVINTSIKIVESSEDDDAWINLEDWQEWKPVIVSIWIALHDAAYRHANGMPQNERLFTLHKGD
jgi:hypothetical protein